MRNWNLIDGYRRGMNAIIRFLGLTGGWIINYPNAIFYFLLVLGSIFLPYFAVFLVISLLCWSYGG